MKYEGHDDELWMCIDCASEHKFHYVDEADITLSTRNKLNKKMK